jgi:hypothetical protein
MFQDMVQDFEMFFVSFCVNKKVINVDYDVGNVLQEPLHEDIKTGWANQKAHWRCISLVLTLARNCESCEGL